MRSLPRIAWHGDGNAVVTPVRKSAMTSFLLVLLIAACGDTTGPQSVASPAARPVVTTVSAPAPTGASKSTSTSTSYRPNKADSQGIKGPNAINMVKHSSNYAVAF